MSEKEIKEFIKKQFVSNEAVRSAGTWSEVTANTAPSAGIRGCPSCVK